MRSKMGGKPERSKNRGADGQTRIAGERLTKGGVENTGPRNLSNSEESGGKEELTPMKTKIPEGKPQELV